MIALPRFLKSLVLITAAWFAIECRCSETRAADKVVISYSSRSYAFLPAQVAVAKGFFKTKINAKFASRWSKIPSRGSFQGRF